MRPITSQHPRTPGPHQARADAIVAWFLDHPRWLNDHSPGFALPIAMHIIIGLITALAGLIWALYSLQNSGVDLNSFNPFTWARRRRWQRLHGTKPIFTLERPMEAAALLMVGVLKQEGEISREQKAAVIELFKSQFHLDDRQAQEVFTSSVYLLKDEINLDQSVRGILAPSKASFTPEQAASLLELLNRVATLEGAPTDVQQRIIDVATEELAGEPEEPGTWH